MLLVEKKLKSISLHLAKHHSKLRHPHRFHFSIQHAKRDVTS